MKPSSRELRLPRLRAEAHFEPATLDAEARTVDLLVYSGATVDRFPLWDDPYRLTFALDAKSVRMGRLQAGAPLKAGHGRDDDLSAVVGVVESAHLAPDGLRARVRFSRRAEVEPLFQDVRDRVIRNVSMEAIVHRIQDVSKKGDREKHLLAVDWEPAAVALIGVPADPGAHALALDGELHPCTLSRADGALEVQMDNETTTLEAEDLASEKALKAARKREDEAYRHGRFYGLGELWAKKQIDSGASTREILLAAQAERAARTPWIDNRIDITDDYDSPGARLAAMGESLSARARRVEPTGPGQRYAGASLVEVALEVLSWRGHHRGLDARRNRSSIIDLALHTTSDFPLLLGNVLNKSLLPAYESAQPTFRLIAARRSFNDFRPQRFLRAGDFPVPLQVNEHGEIKSGTMSESQELVSVLTYGRIFGISRQALVNDDLGAFEQLAVAAANRVADLHNSLFFSICIAPSSGVGPLLADGLAVYHSTHANITGAGALDLTRLSSARQLMMQQTSLDGLKLNILPRYLLVSPASLTSAEQLTATINPQTTDAVNPFASRLVAIGDANLSGSRFYTLADPARLPNYVYGGLDGEPALRVEVRAGFEIEGVEMKVVTDFACGAIDHRGGATGAGA